MYLKFVTYLYYFFSREKLQLRKIKSLIGFFPFHLSYYQKALTHKSLPLIDKKGKSRNNERLEFLGDAILDAIVSDYLFKKFPEGNEGLLTKFRSKIVNGDFLNHIAIKIGIPALLKLKTSNNWGTINLYGNALEAIIGAIYMDRGYKTAYLFVTKHILINYVDFDKIIHTETNYKSMLVEWAQRNKKEISFSTHKKETPTSNQPEFVSVIIINSESYGKGEGHSKKEAEQGAACNTLLHFGLS